MSQPCFTKESPPLFNVILGLVINTAAFAAYTPQILKLWQLRSNEGLSALSIILANFSNAATMYNAINQNWDRLICCRLITFWECTKLLVSFVQLCIIFVAWFIIFISFVSLYPHPKTPKEYVEISSQKRIVNIVFWVFYFVFLIGGSVMIFTWNFFYNRTDAIYRDTDIAFSIIAAVTQALIWVPQIWTTFVNKDPGALSLLMLGFTTPGSVLTVYNQIAYHNPIQVWAPFVIAGACQACLLVMCFIFWLNKEKKIDIVMPQHIDGRDRFASYSSSDDRFLTSLQAGTASESTSEYDGLLGSNPPQFQPSK